MKYEGKIKPERTEGGKKHDAGTGTAEFFFLEILVNSIFQTLYIITLSPGFFLPKKKTHIYVLVSQYLHSNPEEWDPIYMGEKMEKGGFELKQVEGNGNGWGREE